MKERLNDAMRLIMNFLYKERGPYTRYDLSSIDKIKIAFYTFPTENVKHETLVTIDLIHFRRSLFYDGIRMVSESYNDLDDMIKNYLEQLKYETSVTIQENAKMFASIITMITDSGWMIFNSVKKKGAKYYVEIENGSPAGEDLYEIIQFDGTIEGFVKSVRKIADGEMFQNLAASLENSLRS